MKAEEKQTLTEWKYGKGAVIGTGHLFMRPRRQVIKNNKTIHRILVTGIIFFEGDENVPTIHPNTKKDCDELWEVELIFKPKSKRKGRHFWGWLLEDILTDKWTDKNNWDKPYFKREE